jgi:O-antigen/teichoic acid export membrane protein
LRIPDFWPRFTVVLIIVVLPLIIFGAVTFGSRTLLPADNLFAVEPWRSFASQLGVGVPHNELLSDLILENYVWKQFIRESLASGQVPLWNPNLFGGLPFLAAGQHSALYPFSLIFYILPLSKAYGWFVALQFVLAGLFMYVYGRVLGLNRFGALLAAITYMLSAFFVFSVVFPMVIAAAVWLPLILTAIEVVIKKQEEKGPVPYSPIPYIILGALALGLQVLAGHVEVTYYVLMVAGFYALWRLIALWRSQGTGRPALRLAVWLLVMVILGLGLGAVQFIPLYEVGQYNFRVGSASYKDVVGWAYPWRQLVTFLIPNFYGNPSHHSYWDLASWQWLPVLRNALGEPLQTVAWLKELPDWKNYVEAAAYVGILPLLLALVAFLGRRTRHVWLFGTLAVVSLLFAFGTPLYAVLYYLLPGFNQLHSPFRWIFPYTFSIAVLAGVGASYLSGTGRQTTSSQSPFVDPKTPRRIGWPVFWAGIAGLALLAAVLIAPGPFISLADQVLARSELTRRAFESGRMLLSYQWRNLLVLVIFAISAGAVLRISQCPIYLPKRLGGYGLWKPLAVIVLALDLIVAAYGFNPTTDQRLLDFKPPVAEFLQRDKGLWRLTSFVGPGEKTFIANAGMFYGLQDIRGYDSIFPKQYAEYMGAIEPQDELLYNRIAPLSEYESLDSPLLDLLNVKYVVTTQYVPNPGYKLVYDGEVRVYENLDAMPRAFILPATAAQIKSRTDIVADLPRLDPRRELWLESEQVAGNGSQPVEAGHVSGWNLTPATVTSYDINDVTIETDLPGEGYLVLADTYFSGWKAYQRAPEASTKEEKELPIYRADGNFRAVHLDAGRHLVHFKYTPLSFKLGLYVSFMSAIILLLLAGAWLWGRYYRESAHDQPGKRIAKNSLTPMSLSLLNKVIDMAFAMLMLRILTPENAGSYTFAVAFFTFFEILVRFGFGTLLTREVAKDRAQANRYLGNTLVLRTGLWLVSLPVMTVVLALYMRYGGVTTETATAIGLLAVALWFSVVSDSLTSVFFAYEKMEHPAALSTMTTVLRVLLGALVLLPPLSWGIVGLAGVAIVTNIFTAVILFSWLVRDFFTPHIDFDRVLGRNMVIASFPLMINHLLQTIFFRIDIWILQPTQGAAAVGYYSAAYKYIDGLNVVPSLFTMAIFPVMSRFATESRASLLRAYILALRLLLMISIPVAVVTPFIARALILILGGREYLPDSAIALQLLIFYFPFSCMNQVTQYVLIAIDQQRYLTRAFAIGVSFNVVMNLIFIPLYSYKAAAVITVFSEIALLVPFYYCVHKNLGAVPWLAIGWRPLLASAPAGLVMWVWPGDLALLAVPLAASVYLVGLFLLGAFRGDDMDIVLRMVPAGKLRQRLDHLRR